MDDRTKGVGRPDDIAGRAAEDVTGRSAESMRDYARSTERPADAGAPAGSEVDPEADRIRRDIENTREGISETIEAIQDKLRPSKVVSNATQRVKEATTERVRQMTQSAGDAANRMMYGTGGRSEGFVGGIRENPLPAALIGIGAAWLYMRSRSESHDRSRYRFDDRYRAAEDYTDPAFRTREYGRDEIRTYPQNYSRGTEGTGFLDRVKNNPVPATLAGLGLGWLAFAGQSNRDWESNQYRGARMRYSEDADQFDSTASGVTESMSNAASTVADSARHMTTEAQEYTREAAQRIRQTGQRAQTQLERLSRENPLAVGAAALLLGAAVGLAIPETERENELMGETRDSMVDRAQQMARDAASRAQDAASDLAGEATKRVLKGE
jgi:hypothetical protein